MVLILMEVAEEEKDFIATLNRKQLKRGKQSDGTDMPLYAPGSRQPSAPGKITLFDKGDFHRGIDPLFKGQAGFEMDSSDSKTAKLIERYGEHILGLTEESQKRLSKHLLPKLKFKILDRLRYAAT